MVVDRRNKEERGTFREASIYIILIVLIASFLTAEIVDYKKEADFFKTYTSHTEVMEAFVEHWEPYMYHLQQSKGQNSQKDLSLFSCDIVFIRENQTEETK